MSVDREIRRSQRPVALVLCPTWLVDTPPLGIAYIKAVLNREGWPVVLHDFNARLYKSVAGSADLKELWGRRAWFISHGSQLFPILYPDLFQEDYWHFRDEHEPWFRKLAHEWAQEILSSDPWAVGFTVSCNTTMFSLLTAGAIKRLSPMTRIVFGGPNCSDHGNASVFLRTGLVDAVVTGEGEHAIVSLLERWQRGMSPAGLPGVVSSYRGAVFAGPGRPVVRDLDTIPFPDFSGFDPALYVNGLKQLPILTSRGCMGACRFCFDRRFWSRFRFRTARNVLNEILSRVLEHGTNELFFADLLLNGNLRELDKLCDLLIAEGSPVRWWGNARVKPMIPDALLRKMRKAGCQDLHYGLENGSDKVLSLMKKGCTVRDYDIALKRAFDAGISVSAGFIVGFPGETEDDLEDTMEFIHRNRKHLYQVHVFPLALMYGSSLWDQMNEFGLEVPPYYLPKELEWARSYKYPFIGEWRSSDGSNTEAMREERAQRLRDFCSSIGLGHYRHGKGREELYENSPAP